MNNISKKLNNLSGKAWIKLSKSTWITQKLLEWSHHTPLTIDSSFLKNALLKNTHPMTYRPLNESYVKLIELLTKPNQVIFDPNIEKGDTLQAALFAKRQFIGIGQTAAQCRQAIQQLDSQYHEKNFSLWDKLYIEEHKDLIPRESADLLLTQIPKFNLSLGVQQYHNTFEHLKNELLKHQSLLKPNAYLALIISDQRLKNQYYCCHSDLIEHLKDSSLTLQGIINMIQDSRALTAYGYPSTYVPNIINQFVLIYRNTLC